MNEGLTGTTWGLAINDTIFIFGWPQIIKYIEGEGKNTMHCPTYFASIELQLQQQKHHKKISRPQTAINFCTILNEIINLVSKNL